MATNLSKPRVPSKAQNLHYVPRNGQIIKLPWSQLTEAERDDLRKADERVYQVVLHGIYA